MRYLYLFFFLIFTNLYAQNEDIKNTEKIKLQLQWQHQFEFAGFYAAKEKGFYKDVGLDVDFIEFDPKTNIVDEVLNGNADYGITYSSLIADYMQGKPLVFVANFFKQSPLVIATQKNIYTPADLKGKKVMGLLDNSHKHLVLGMLDRFGVKAEDLENVTREFSLDRFINKEVDAISVFTTDEIYTLNKLGIKYNILDPAAFGTRFYALNLFTTKKEFINNSIRLENFRNATIKGWEYALKNKEELVEIIIQKYNTQNKSKDALLFEAQQIEYSMLSNIYPVGSIDSDMVKMIADNLAQALFLEKISKEELEAFIYKSDISSLELNPEEKEYLKNKKEIKLCVNPNWLPLEKVENGKHIGIAAEYMDAISKKLNIPITLIETTQLSESLENIEQRKCDILSLVERTASRDKYLDFTTPYITTPFVIATKSGLPFIDNIKDIKGKTIGIIKNYSISKLLKDKYPDINLVEVDSAYEGLVLVEQDRNFAFLDNAMVINNEIQKNSMNFISVTGQFSESFNLGMASRNDEPILKDILQKALLSIDEKQKLEFMQKWNNINYQTKVNNQVIVQILFFTIVFISIFLYWNLKLKEEIRIKELTKEQLKQSEEKYRILFDISPVLLNSFDKNGNMILWNNECEKVFGWTLKEIQETQDQMGLFYDEELKEVLIEDFKINNSVFKEWYPRRKDGKILIVKWANVKLPSGEIMHIGHDITEQRENESLLQENTLTLEYTKQQLEKLNNTLEKRIEEEISKNTKQQIVLMQQTKLAQMGEMIQNIAHQWRQPLSQINSSVLLLDAYLGKKDSMDEAIESKISQIETLTEYLSRTIDDFQSFFDPDKKKTLFKISSAVQTSLNIVKGKIDFTNTEIIYKIDENLEFFGQKEELQQVLLVILNNAIDSIKVNKILNPQILISAFIEKNFLIISIQDNALGIKSINMDRVFEPYFTTKHKSQGTGIGLYMAKTIIENGFKGDLSVENSANGARFVIKLPKGKV